MAPLSNKEKVELAKKRLHISDKNPFEVRKNAKPDRNNVFNKRFNNIQDDRIRVDLPEKMRNCENIQKIRAEIGTQKSTFSTVPKSEEQREEISQKKTKQEVYMEIMAKSKAAKAER